MGLAGLRLAFSQAGHAADRDAANPARGPAPVLPVSLTMSALPVAVQITGRPGADALVLRLSKALEDAIGWAGLPE